MLKLVIALTGWVLLCGYFLYEYSEHGSGLLKHFISPGHPVKAISHMAIFLMPFLTTYLGYLIYHNEKLLKKAETERAKGESIIEAMGDAVSIQDTTFRIIYQNRLHREWLGSHAGEYCYKAYQNNDSICEGCHLAITFRDGRIHVKEQKRTTAKGTLYYEITSSPITDSSGTIIAGIEAVREITARKRADEELIKRGQALETSIDGIVFADLSGTLTYVNKAFIAMWGYDGQCECAGKSMLEFWHKAEDAAVVIRALQEKGSWLGELVGKRKDGSLFDVHLSATTLLDNEANPVGLMGSFNNITERKRTEEALQLTRFTVDNVADAVYWMDSTAQIVDVNETACSMLGYTREELLNLTVLDIDTDFTADRWVNAWEAVKSQGKLTLETRHQTKDGRMIPVEIMANYLRFGDRELDCAFARDISHRKRAEEDLLKTEKLESLGILAGGIAHDFNNLLQGVFGYISMAKMTLDRKEKSFSMLEQAEHALHMSVNLTSQLLTFSKGGKPVKKKISLQQVIQNSARFALSGSSVDYRINLEDGLRAVEADEGQISQVIQNILINADQAMPEGGSIEITATNGTAPYKDHPQLSKGNYIEIAIQDSGVGIPEKYREKIFDPYFTTKEKGSGLGLATSYSIIRNHGGLIDVASEPGMGTTFFIYLPAVETEKEIKETVATSSPALKGKVLVMDDEDIILDIAGEMIKIFGHEVEFAKNGEAALEKYQSAMESGKPFDIVILDLTIRGGMGGAETIERLRAIDPGVKAIVSSGYSEDDIVADYEKYGFSAQLTKPYRLNGLKDTLNALLTA